MEGEILLTTSTSVDHSKFYSADSKAGADPRVNPPSKKIKILLRGSPICDPLHSGLALDCRKKALKIKIFHRKAPPRTGYSEIFLCQV